MWSIYLVEKRILHWFTVIYMKIKLEKNNLNLELRQVKTLYFFYKTYPQFTGKIIFSTNGW